MPRCRVAGRNVLGGDANRSSKLAEQRRWCGSPVRFGLKDC